MAQFRSVSFKTSKGVIYDNQNEILYGKVDRIGEGGFGNVWKCEDVKKTGKHYAVKVIKLKGLSEKHLKLSYDEC